MRVPFVDNPTFLRFQGKLGLSLIALGLATLVWVGQLTLFDMIRWGKDITCIFFSSRTAEYMFPTLGIDMRVIHYFLLGLALLLPGIVTFHTRPKKSKSMHACFGYLENLPKDAPIPLEGLLCEHGDCIEGTHGVDCCNEYSNLHDTVENKGVPKMLKLENLTSPEAPEVPEEIARTKVIVYKSRVDPAAVRLTAEKMKNKSLVKFDFSRPNQEEVLITSVDKYYEPYILMDARYTVDYFKWRDHTFDLEEGIEQVGILGEVLKPETVVGHNREPRKVFKLKAKEWFSYEDKAYFVLDRTGHKIPLDLIPTTVSEENPHRILKEAGEKVRKINFSRRKGIEAVKARFVKRPPVADGIEKELFQISELLVIYTPVYEVTFRNMKTGEERIIKIDGVTPRTRAWS